jgi:hypothetical protein
MYSIILIYFFPGVYHALDEYLCERRYQRPPTEVSSLEQTKTFNKCVEPPDAADTDGEILSNVVDDGFTVAAALNNDEEWNAIIDCLFPDFYELRSNCDTCSIDKLDAGSADTRIFHGEYFDECAYNWKKYMLCRFLKDL